MSIVRVENLSFEYSDFRAIDNISFEIAQGSITALVGPNGAGKTTLMKCMTALLNSFTGSIKIDGLDVRENPREVHRLVGFLPDFFGLYEALTVEQCLKYACLSHAVPLNLVAERATEAMNQVNLADKRKALVSELSRGMRQRLAIAQSIVHRPKLLILDEPASGLDPEARSSLAALFRKLNRDGMTLLVSSHILAELDEYATSLLSMKTGRLSLKENRVTNVKRRLIFKTKGMDGDLTAFSSLAGTTVFKKENHFHFDFHGAEADQQELLKRLISAGVPVTEFFIERDSLQQLYLNQTE